MDQDACSSQSVISVCESRTDMTDDSSQTGHTTIGAEDHLSQTVQEVYNWF